MLKSKLLSTLSSVFSAVGTPSLLTATSGEVVANFANVKWYEVPVMVGYSASEAGFFNIQFYVVDEGLGTEAAYFKKDQVEADLLKSINLKLNKG